VILGQSLNDWIAATAQRDVEWQMSFYMPVLTTFYRQSDVPQDFVREEKARLFADAQTVNVRLLSEPQITFSEGGRVATMRILLSEVTEDGGQNRLGKVMRELRWRKTDEGWKIFSERDL
jgi:ketosteroid isomerase-like protein